jgi:DNA-binding transcriptional regulator YiaG
VNPTHLFLGTAGDNCDDKMQKGRHNSGRKLTPKLVREIRQQYATGGMSQHKLAARYGIAQMTVSKLVRRETWNHVR